MANIKIKDQPYRRFGETVPYGNTTTLAYKLKTDTNGAAENSDHGDPVDIADVLDLGMLPGGFRLDDAQIIVTTAMTASVTCSLGFKYEDGEDVASAPEDAAYFGSSLSLASAGRVRATGSKSVTTAKAARLVMTIAGAKNVKASDITVIVSGEIVGLQ